MNTNEEADTLPAGLRQLLVDAASSIEELTNTGYLIESPAELRPHVSLAGRLRDAAAGKPLMRSWDVTVTTIVNVKMPYGVDPSTDAGVDAIKEAIPGKVVDCIDEGAFDISCEEYLDG